VSQPTAPEPPPDLIADMRPPTQRVEIIVPLRTLVVLLAFATLVVLAILSLGTLLSIFLAGVLALGLDPVVGALVTRGWGRGRAALFVFAMLFAAVLLIVLITVTPLWDQIKDFIREIPNYWDEVTSSAAFQKIVSQSDQQSVHDALKDLVNGLPDAASTLLGAAGGIFGGVLSLVTLTFLALFLLMERPSVTDWLFGFTPPAVEARWRPVLEESIVAVSASLIGNVAISLVAATVAGLSAWAFGLPFPIVLAMITGFLDLIPQIGATIAAIILVFVGLSEHRGSYRHARHPAHLPAGRELHRLPDRLPARRGALGVHHDRLRADRGLAAGRGRGDPRRPVRGGHQDRAARGRPPAARQHGGAARRIRSRARVAARHGATAPVEGASERTRCLIAR
jgi:predicted PurR-regulated permease PerM